MDYFSDALNCLRTLVSINSVEGACAPGAPFGIGNRQALDYMLSTLSDMGFRTKCGDGYYGYGEIGDIDKPLFGILGHLDVVPVTEGWSHPPFAADIADGYMWGRGTEDDKGPTVAAIFAAKELLDEGRIPKVRLRFILGSNEESGWRCMDKYRECEELPEMGFSPDADFPVINCEKGVAFLRLTLPLPCGVLSLSSGTRANVVPDRAVARVSAEYSAALPPLDGVTLSSPVDGVITLTASGKSAHGSTPWEGDNALVKLLGYLASHLPSPVSSDVSRIYDLVSRSDGSGLGIRLSDEVSGSLTMNPGVASSHGGVLTLDVDIRHPVTIARDDVIARVQKAIGHGSVSLVSFHDPLYVPKDHPLVTSLLDAYKKVTGDLSAEPITIGGATYARVLPVGVGFGPVFPGEKSYIHMTDERISLQNFRMIMDIYKEAIASLCFE